MTPQIMLSRLRLGQELTIRTENDAAPVTLVRTITTGLNHSGLIALDADGCLYAGNIDGRVTVYPPGATKPSQIITVPGGGPLYTLLIGH